ncbi:MAG: SPOR domain-containing protein, partial [Acidobacteriota bacterium]
MSGPTGVRTLGEVFLCLLVLLSAEQARAGPIPEVRPPVMRIGLSTGEGRVVILSCRSGMHLVALSDGRPVWKDRYEGEVRVVLLGGGGMQTIYRVQVGSFSHEDGAKDLAQRLERELKVPASVHHDLQRRVFRVRMGEFRERTEAAGLTTRL